MNDFEMESILQSVVVATGAGRPREPPHVHVERGEREAKFWLRPEVYLAYKDDFSARELREIDADRGEP